MCQLCIKEGEFFQFATVITKKKVKKKGTREKCLDPISEASFFDAEKTIHADISHITCPYHHSFLSYFRDVPPTDAISYPIVFLTLNPGSFPLKQFENVINGWNNHPQNHISKYFIYQIFSYQSVLLLSGSKNITVVDWKPILSFLLSQIYQIPLDLQITSSAELLQDFLNNHRPPVQVIVLANEQDVLFSLMTEFYSEVISQFLIIQSYLSPSPLEDPSCSEFIHFSANGEIQPVLDDIALVKHILSFP